MIKIDLLQTLYILNYGEPKMDEKSIKNYIDKDTDCLAKYNICVNFQGKCQLTPIIYKYIGKTEQAGNLWIAITLRNVNIVEYYFDNSYHVFQEFSIRSSSGLLSEDAIIIKALKLVHNNISDVSENTIDRFSFLKRNNCNVKIKFDKMEITVPVKNAITNIVAEISKLTQQGSYHKYNLKCSFFYPPNCCLNNSSYENSLSIDCRAKTYPSNLEVFERALFDINRYLAAAHTWSNKDD